MVDARRSFRGIEVLDGGRKVRVQPRATIVAVNSVLARYGRKLGPDPACQWHAPSAECWPTTPRV